MRKLNECKKVARAVSKTHRTGEKKSILKENRRFRGQFRHLFSSPRGDPAVIRIQRVNVWLHA
jgi:hypothetical protein